MDLNLSPLYRVTSKNVSSVSLMSYVNLIVGCIWLIIDMNSSKSFVVPVHMMKISLINRFQVWKKLGAWFISYDSNLPMKR